MTQKKKHDPVREAERVVAAAKRELKEAERQLKRITTERGWYPINAGYAWQRGQKQIQLRQPTFESDVSVTCSSGAGKTVTIAMPPSDLRGFIEALQVIEAL